MKNLKPIVCALALASAVPVMAQPQAGDWEFTLGGGGATLGDDFDDGSAQINGSFGYFYNSNFEIGIRQSVGHGDIWSGRTLLAADYHFLLGQFVPFVGATFGLDYDENGDTWGMGPEAGVKYYVHEKTFIYVRGEYFWRFDEIDRFDNNSDDGSWAFTVGVGFNIGGAQ